MPSKCRLNLSRHCRNVVAQGQQQPSVFGVGATFPQSLYTALTGIYSVYDPAWNYGYTGTSSGAGRSALASGGANLTWAGSDTIPSNVTYADPQGRAAQFIPVPSVVSAIAIVYHLNISSLTLTRQNIADIFSGKITSWNDSRLVQNNPGLSAISAPLQTIVRSGSSGTTSNFQYALNRFDPTLNLPPPYIYPISSWGVASTPFFGSTNQMISDAIQVTPNTIGYVDFPDADSTLHSLTSSRNLYAFANIINQNGDVVTPSMQTIMASLSSLNAVNLSTLSHFSADIGSLLQSTYIDSTTQNAYPLMAPSYVFLRQDSQIYNVTEAQMRATLRLIFWMIFGGTESDTKIRQFAFDALKLVTHNGKALYDPVSPCNPYFDSTGAYDSSVTQCICDVGYYNNMKTDCSEPSAAFMLLVNGMHSGNIAIMAFVAITGLINVAILVLLVIWRDNPNIKPISPRCCYVIMFGSLIGQIGSVFYSAEPSPLICSSRIFFPVIAFSSVFSMLLLKSVRIYMIFENRRMRVFKTPDWKLILITMIIVMIQVVICIIWIVAERPVTQVQGSLYALVCVPSTGAIVAPEALLYTINSLILVGCVVLAYLTRKAHQRFQESKSIAFCSYIVLMTLLLCLPIVYVLSNSTDSQALFMIGRIMVSALTIVISSLVPAALFGVRLITTFKNERSDRESQTQRATSRPSQASSVTSQGMAKANVIAYAYDCGVQGIKFGGAWVSSTVVVFPGLDVIDFREPDSDGAIQASFRFSSCDCGICDQSSDPGSEKALARRVRLRRNKATYFLEFGSKDTALTFLVNHAEVKARPSVASAKKGEGFGAAAVAGTAKRGNTVYDLLDKQAGTESTKSAMD
ncbi:uncharacterized protein BJ171DRAFT_566605 [Polychytrium aggregatum]|uniref:uncharacterized protein n=1 Tax=Polychytrium aggregatum TaxID=110093 RepID=UPI0022FEE268|nr:uncharacterized protein BJ171DRAFT_566605 [Polychytrium aggregatum]KAI9206767.1 hypothetical protein BJ171DRAFT_566605 [Polychytrium aggregatum]